jgi:hypothetical protein
MATLDELSAWGNLDSINSYGSMDALDALVVHQATGSAATSATAQADEPTKAKAFSGSAATAVTVSASATHMKGVTASAATAGAVSASAIALRLLSDAAAVNTSATATITHIQAFTGSAATSVINYFPFPDFNYVVNVGGDAATSVTVTADRPIATLNFEGSAGIDTAASATASGAILGEDWTVVPDTTGVWAIQ